MRILGINFHCLVFFHALCLFGFLIVTVIPIAEKEILLQFKGNISSDPLNILRSWDLSKIPCQDYHGVFCNSEGNVVRIVLWNTSLGGVLSPALAGLKSLRILNLFGNQFTGNIPSEYGGIDSLWKINLSSNALSGSIPEFLGYLPNIRFLDLSRNGYSGEIPSALFENCYKTRFVSLSHNTLSGPIPDTISSCLNIEGIDLSFNRLSGELPLGVCDVPRMAYLSVRSNMLLGSVDRLISQCGSLSLLDLGSNMFTGSAPFMVLGEANLTYFNISWNLFQGEVPDIGSCSSNLQVFDVSGNGLKGQIPISITKCSSLKYFDMGFNKLSGNIPAGISDLKNLLFIRLANNSIKGTVPVEFGSIEWLQVLDLHNLQLGGEIPNEITSCRFLLELDLSGNALEGGIPQNLDNLTNIVNLNLHRNRLNGSMPLSIGNLPRLHSLDLSENYLSGSIPTTLGNLRNLIHFNVSYNNLSGAIPSALQFDFTAFFHNPGLCGPPLSNPCSGSALAPGSTKPKLSVSAIVAIVAAALIVTGVCIIMVVNMKARSGRRKEEKEEEEAMVIQSAPLASTDSNVIIGKLVLFSRSLPSKYEDWEAGTKALLDKECLVGRGSIGTVYKTTFEGGISIAVKKLETLGRIRNQDEFEHEIGRLGNLQHPHLVAVQGYYWSHGMQLILSEYISRGNLYENLHGVSYPGTSATASSNPELNWFRRFRIAIGIARALAYLHHDFTPAVLHLNFKSSNILLDDDYNAKLSDFGLGKLLPLSSSHVFTKMHNAVGYIAPELAQSSRTSDKCDVYSFGVVLLELVTGRKPVERADAHKVLILCDYVRELIERGRALDCLDTSLQGFVETELTQVMKLGLICTCEMPSRRPSMAEVVQVLESIRNGSES